MFPANAEALIPQPARPSLPLRVPVEANIGGVTVHAEVLGSTANVLLLEGEPDGPSLPQLGTPVRLRLEWDRQQLNGRLAAHGIAGRFLVAVGERAIRRSRRFTVNLPGIARCKQLIGAAEVRITDVSAGGARVEGIDFPIGSEIDLHFTPSGRQQPIDVHGFVVRRIEPTDVPTVGIAFRLGQPSSDILASISLVTPP